MFAHYISRRNKYSLNANTKERFALECDYMQKSLYDIQTEFWNQSYQRWRTQELFSLPWFFNIAVLIVFYIIWIKLVDKQNLKELLLFGSFIAVSASFIDIAAITIGLWEYKVRLFPISPAPFPFDYTVIPILYMLVIQYTSSWGSYIIGSLLASGIFSFVISPVYVFLGIKQFHKFNYFYMFILVLVVTTIIKVIYNRIITIGKKNRMRG
jgi:hypothetical protein